MFEVAAPLETWESFYVIVGTSAAALTGLTFVVIALLAEGPRGGDSIGIATFLTPTIVHFCLALLISAILSAPWHELAGARVALGACAAAGLFYVVVVLRRAFHVRGYKLVFEDWLSHLVLPVLAYGTLAAAALLLYRHVVFALFMVGGASLLLVFIGIHNAWDTVTHITITRMMREPAKPG